MSELNNTDPGNLSKFNSVFCDSTEALEWAYENRLPKSAIIKSSSPAMLWDCKPYVNNIESRWTIEKIKKFKDSLRNMTEEIFDTVLKVHGVEREVALIVSQAAYIFQKPLDKAACLDESDFTDPRLIIRVNGKCGPQGNNINPPWDKLLQTNPSLLIIDYTLTNDKWSLLSTQGVSLWRRLQVAGYETIVYRFAVKIMKYMPSWLFKNEILMHNENELLIEAASRLALKGVRITSLSIRSEDNLDRKQQKNDFFLENSFGLYESIESIMRNRVEQYVVPSAVETTLLLFKHDLESQLKKFRESVVCWEQTIEKKDKKKQIVFVNSPKHINGRALALVCRKKNIPLISSPHGITSEINKAYDMQHILSSCNVADLMFLYNYEFAQVMNKIHFNNAKYFVTGAPSRLTRMRRKNIIRFKPIGDIVYISTNLYRMGFSASEKTDYQRAREEYKIINDVLAKLPYRVCYKTYPEDNRRYADIDPAIKNIENINNIDLFSKKVDMRYLLSEYRVLVTAVATSTLGWPVMTGKPVVFINQKHTSPLTDDSYEIFCKALFVFNDEDKDFHENLRCFLSQPIDEIYRLWGEKDEFRKEMIKKYFSEYNEGAGRRAAKEIIKEYF